MLVIECIRKVLAVKAKNFAKNTRQTKKPRTAGLFSFNSGSFPQHNANDLPIRLAHALPGQAPDVADGVLHALGHDAVAAVELATRAHHVVAHDARLHRHGDLGGAGGLGSVADSARQDGHGVDQGMGDLTVAAARQVADAATTAAACADRAAVGRQAPDARLLVDGDEVGYQ